MRMGMSWPAGGGRREWISMGPAGWLVIGPLILFGVLFVGAVWLAGELLKAGGQVTVWAYRRYQARSDHPRAR